MWTAIPGSPSIVRATGTARDVTEISAAMTAIR